MLERVLIHLLSMLRRPRLHAYRVATGEFEPFGEGDWDRLLRVEGGEG